MNTIRNDNVIYIQPSEWAAKVWEINPFCNNIKIGVLPFGVDTIKFSEKTNITHRNKVFIYFKDRNPQELKLLTNFLNNKNIPYVIFSYKSRYNEQEYINYLQNSKLGIWLGRHESQGFALEEALSCNVPLLVWNVKSMNQEYGSTYADIPATTIPYWDERCGEYFYDFDELENKFNTFLSKIETYKPREYILENLSIKKCEEKLNEIIKNI
jgi:glycosyltransferase involved in cell wall biosynthesis